jgi:hypothetical protein
MKSIGSGGLGDNSLASDDLSIFALAGNKL